MMWGKLGKAGEVFIFCHNVGCDPRQLQELCLVKEKGQLFLKFKKKTNNASI